MDTRDSSTQSSSLNRDNASSTSGGGGGGGGNDYESPSSLTAALAKDAFSHFQSGRFSECLDVLYQLKQKKEDDPKVQHNIAIVKYFEDGFSSPKKLLEILNAVKKRSEELARASREKVEAVNNSGNKASVGSKATGTAYSSSAANTASSAYVDELDSVVATLNIAIIWYHLHEYTKSLQVLEPLYLNIEPVDETVALHLCLLLLDVALYCQDAFKFADVLLYLEKAFGVGSVGQGDNGSAAQQQYANLVAKSTSTLCNSSGMDASNFEVPPSSNGVESLLSRTLSMSEDPLEIDMVLSLDLGDQNLPRPSSVLSPNDSSGAPFDRSVSTVDLKFQLQLYKVQFLLLTRSLKQAKREVKLAMNIARGRDSSMALLLKSQLEYARGNYRKAIKLLMASSNKTEVGNLSMLNNLGCIYYQLGKYHISSVLFSKALTACSTLRKDKPPKLSTFSQDKSLLIMYNCGLQQLACGKPLLAASCFQKASMVYYKWPLLWLRLAECCLMALRMKFVNSRQHSSEKSEIAIHVIGNGKWRSLALENGISKNGKVDSVEKEMIMGNSTQPKLSLSLARQCLLNALHLLETSALNCSKSGLPSDISLEENEVSDLGPNKHSDQGNLSGLESKVSNLSLGLSQINSNGDAKELKLGTSQEVMQNCISYYEDIQRREDHMIKQALLANLAYVELELKNPQRAFSIAKLLLELPECSRIYRFLGHVYASEALCLLNKPKEAAEHLSRYLSGGSNVEVPFSQEDVEQLRVERIFDNEEPNGGSVPTKNSVEASQGIASLKPEQARGMLLANFATMYATQGDLDRAQQFITQALTLIPNSREATLTAVFVDLKLGKSREAIEKLKQCSQVRFVPSSVQLSKC